MQKTHTYIEALAANGLFYRLYGAENPGAPIVLIMGYGGCMFAWPLEFAARLAQQRKVLIFDHKGTGRSAPLGDDIDLRMSHFAEDLKGLLGCLNFESAAVFGYSLGGCVALEFARMYPQFVEGMILQSTTAGGALYTGADQEVKDRLANPRGRNFDEMYFDFIDLCMSPEAVQARRPLLNDVCANARPYPTSPKVMMRQLAAFKVFDAASYVNQITAKSLLFHGKNDRILKVRNGEMLAAQLPNCQSELLEDCGHCPHIEHEDFVVNAVGQFLQ